LGTVALSAQQAASKDADVAKQENAAGTKQEPSKRSHLYRCQYTLAELNGKERINARTFEILTTGRGEMSTGSHIPLFEAGGTGNPGSVGNRGYQYGEVGLNFNMDVAPLGEEDVSLRVDAMMTTLVKSEDVAQGKNTVQGLAVTRRTEIKANTAVKLGVPTVIGRIDDVASAHSFELSVKVTR
jgi:hypothetical protein